MICASGGLAVGPRGGGGWSCLVKHEVLLPTDRRCLNTSCPGGYRLGTQELFYQYRQVQIGNRVVFFKDLAEFLDHPVGSFALLQLHRYANRRTLPPFSLLPSPSCRPRKPKPQWIFLSMMRPLITFVCLRLTEGGASMMITGGHHPFYAAIC